MAIHSRKHTHVTIIRFIIMETTEQVLFSYKMTENSEFAPNPHFGILTLATCKPQIRKTKKIGQWIAGFTSLRCGGTKVGEERLIYLMKVTDKITYDRYWAEYPQKRNNPDADDLSQYGDNIYQPLGNGNYRQTPNNHHDEHNRCHDLHSNMVLLSTEFYYFGKCHALKIPPHLRPNIPKGQCACGVRSYDIDAFIDYVRKNAPADIPRNRTNRPCNECDLKHDCPTAKD